MLCVCVTLLPSCLSMVYDCTVGPTPRVSPIFHAIGLSFSVCVWYITSHGGKPSGKSTARISSLLYAVSFSLSLSSVAYRGSVIGDSRVSSYCYKTFPKDPTCLGRTPLSRCAPFGYYILACAFISLRFCVCVCLLFGVALIPTRRLHLHGEKKKKKKRGGGK